MFISLYRIVFVWLDLFWLCINSLDPIFSPILIMGLKCDSTFPIDFVNGPGYSGSISVLEDKTSTFSGVHISNLNIYLSVC